MLQRGRPGRSGTIRVIYLGYNSKYSTNNIILFGVQKDAKEQQSQKIQPPKPRGIRSTNPATISTHVRGTSEGAVFGVQD